jgi:hypothetical protein
MSTASVAQVVFDTKDGKKSLTVNGVAMDFVERVSFTVTRDRTTCTMVFPADLSLTAEQAEIVKATPDFQRMCLETPDGRKFYP